MKRSERAVELKHSGCNCCQAVLMAFAEDLETENATLMKIGAAFGGGMGCMEATCGALCGAQMLLGLAAYEGKPMGRDARGLLEAFRARAGAVKCADLKGVETGVVLCGCDDCVRYAAELVEEKGLFPERA